MNKDFIENCKLLKSHFTKLTQAQRNTTSQSKFDFESSSAAATINRAEQLLFLDRIDLLDKIDIEDIKQHALVKYATKTNRLCEKNNIFKWNDDIYCTPSVQCNKVLVLDKVPENSSNDEYNTKKEQILDEFDKLEEASKVAATKKGIIDGTKTEIKKNKHSEEHKDKKAKTTIQENTKKHEKIEPKKSEEMPELKIIPQQTIDINTILEIKKIIPSDDDDDNVVAEDKVQPKNDDNKKRSRDSHSSKINSFLENVEKFQKFTQEKSKSFVNLAETKTTSSLVSKTEQTKNKSVVSLNDKLTSYAHRFKAQKSIIEMQKEKLMEQNKLIAELQLNKIQIQAKESLENAQKELKKISPVLRHKSKIYDETKRDDPNEKLLSATLKLSKAPKMMQHMAQRAREREQRRQLINERKRLLEEEKQRIIERTIKKKMEDEQMDKQKRLAKFKEQREQLRLAEQHKQELKQRYIEINEIAHQHYKKKLKKTAIERFKMVIYRIRIKTEIGIRFYDNNIVIKYLQIWRSNVRNLNAYKEFVSKRFFKKHCLKSFMKIWRKHHLETVQRNQVAIDRYEMSLQNNFFFAWLQYTRNCKAQFKIDAKKADLHYNRAILYQYIHCWRSLPAILAIERVQLERRRKWRLRVAQILTDYDPLKSEIK